MLRRLHEIMRGDVEQALLHLFSDQLSEAEAAAMRNRVERDSRYREEFEGSLEVLASMEGLADDRQIRTIAVEYSRLLQKHRFRRSVALGMAAGLLLAFGAAVTFFSPWSGSGETAPQEYSTRIGEQRTIELDDGSVVMLNTASRLAVDYSAQVRRIRLEQGEAYFVVAEDRQRPFTVNLGALSATALGTEFNLRRHPGHYQIAVIEGAVAWHASTVAVSSLPAPTWADGQEVVLSPAAQHGVAEGWVAEFNVNHNRLKAYRPASMDRFHDWRSGTLVFYREPLHRVIEELNRYSRREIRIEDAAVRDLSVYTTASIQEIDSVLDGLEMLLPIEVTRNYDRIVIRGTPEP